MKAILLFIFGIFSFCLFIEARSEELCPNKQEQDFLRSYLQTRDLGDEDPCKGTFLSIATVNLAFDVNIGEKIPNGLLLDMAATQMLATEAVGGFSYTSQFIPWGNWSYTIEDLDARFYELVRQEIHSGESSEFCQVVNMAPFFAAIPISARNFSAPTPSHESIVRGMWKHLSNEFVDPDEILTLCRYYF